jgi:hypothetical protein
MEITWEADPPPQVRYSVKVELDDGDLDRIKQLAPSWPADHELKISERKNSVVRATWSFDAPKGRYDAPKRLLQDAGFQVVQYKHAMEPGVVYIAAHGRATAI